MTPTPTAKKRGRKPKSNFYHIRCNHVGINEEMTAEILGVTVKDVKQFDIEGAPVMAEKLLAMWDKKHIGIEGWEGFLFSRGALINKNKRWKPQMLHEYHDREKRILSLENELKRIQTINGAWKNLCTVFVDKLMKNKRKRHNL